MTKIFYDEWGNVIILKQCIKCFMPLKKNKDYCTNCGAKF